MLNSSSRFFVFKLIIIGFLLNGSGLADAAKTHPCLLPKNPLCGAIHKLSPKMKLADALKLSNSFTRVARKYKVPSQLLVSIAMQESRFRLSAVRNVSGLVQNDEGLYEKKVVGSDFCMMQINAYNIIKMELDAQKLVTNEQYCIEAGARILASFQGKKKTDKSWWTRYNAISDLHRTIYQKHVMKHWRIIDPQIDHQNEQLAVK